MPETFDPYYKWLGIPPAQQPPHHYRLLGVELFESDVEVIDMAANQRMSYLQEMAGGAHGKVSQRLLNEVSAARRCLLDKTTKAAYDEKLRAKLPKPATVVTESRPPDGDEDDTINVGPTVNVAVGKFAPKPTKGPTAKPATAPPDGDASFNFQVDDTKAGKPSKSKTVTSKSTAGKSAASKSKSTGRAAGDAETGKNRKKKSRAVPLALALVVLAAAGGGGYEFYRRSLASKEAPPVVAVATTPSATAAPAEPSSTDETAAASSTGPSPAATPSSTTPADVAAAQAMFTSAISVQNLPGSTPTATAAKGPAAAPSPSAPKSSIVAAAEASPPPTEFFLGGAASPNAAAPGIHLQPRRNLPGRIVGFFKSGAEYHLFYESVVIARRVNSDVWGHAVSSDLVSWREAPLTVEIDPKRPAAIGSIFVDAENISGLGEAGKPVWLAVCTFGDAKKTEFGYAASRNQGATWTFAKEPIKVEGGLPVGSSRPRIVRDAERKQWCLVALTKQVTKPTPAATYTIYTSPDLKTWTNKQVIPLTDGTGAPDFFEIAEASPGKARRWIFAGGNGRYMLGQFDGQRFTSDRRNGQLFGAGYAWFRTLDDSPGESRRLATGVVAALPADKQPPYGIAVALPQVFTLVGGEAAPSLNPAECAEVQKLAGKSIDRAAADLPAGAPITIDDCGPTYRFMANFEAGQAEAVEVILFGEKVRVDFKAKTLSIGDVTTPFEATSVQLQGIVDRDVAELKRPTGWVALSTRSGPGVTPFKLDAIGGTAKLQGVSVVPLVRPAGKP